MKHVVAPRVPHGMRLLRLSLLLRKTALRALTALVDARVPGRLKIIAVVGSVLVLSPLNLLGDIPLLGIVDDAGLLALVLVWFTRASAPYLQTLDG